MPRWVKGLLLSLGIIFIAVGAAVGIFGTRAAQARADHLATLRPLSAATLQDQPAGAEALVAGTLSASNPVVFRDYVAYVREELRVTTNNSGSTSQTWRTDTWDTPPLTLDAGGAVRIPNEGYTIELGHELWYDDVTLDFHNRPRDRSKRYSGLIAGRPVIAYGTVVDGADGKELTARSIYGGTHAEYLASQRAVAAFMPILGGIFDAVGLVLAAIAVVFIVRR